MPIYDRPTWQLMRQFVEENKRVVFTIKDIKNWFRTKYPQIKENTVYLHTRNMLKSMKR